MKKLMTLAALVAACAPAFTAEVTSSNTVGYQKITLQPGLNMIGGLFQNVATGAALDLQEQFADAASNSNYGTAAGVADQIVTWDTSRQGYTKIYYFYADPTNPDPVYDYTWDDTDTDDVTDADIAAGKGGWYKNYGDTAITLTMAGQAPTNASYTVSVGNGLNFVGNPYPCAVPLNGNFFEAENAVYGTAAGVADQIVTWDASRQGYTKIYYFYADPDNPDPVYDYTWDDTDTDDITDFAIQPGQGFWYKHIGSGATLTFRKPY